MPKNESKRLAKDKEKKKLEWKDKLENLGQQEYILNWKKMGKSLNRRGKYSQCTRAKKKGKNKPAKKGGVKKRLKVKQTD